MGSEYDRAGEFQEPIDRKVVGRSGDGVEEDAALSAVIVVVGINQRESIDR